MDVHIFGQGKDKDKEHLDPSIPKDINKVVKEINIYLTNRGFGPLEKVPVLFNVLEQMVGSFLIFLRERSAEDQLKVFEEIHKLGTTFTDDVKMLMSLMRGDDDA